MPTEGGRQPQAPAATVRVFFALWPPAELAERLAALAANAAARWGGRATRPQTVHLTLAFLGEISQSALPDLCAAAASVRGEAFSLVVDRLGYWSHNRLLWAGCGVAPPSLFLLQDRLKTAVAQSGFAVDAFRRPFNPHLTLVRHMRMDPGRLEPIDSSINIGHAWECMRFVLVGSVRDALGSAYSTIAEFKLREPQAVC